MLRGDADPGIEATEVVIGYSVGVRRGCSARWRTVVDAARGVWARSMKLRRGEDQNCLWSSIHQVRTRLLGDLPDSAVIGDRKSVV